MLFIKVMSDDQMTGLEAIEIPVYVKRQMRNNVIVRCSEPQAQGIVSLDEGSIYQLDGKVSLGDGFAVAVPITMAEYDELALEVETTDPEDTAPEVPEETTEEEILTRAELTAKVAALEEELAAAKILLGVE